ncbi:hypothetical protein Pta02_39870 [Planobispora takensis]|uniref:Uncharacterized protein n=1 Tax=Planobispora takensis TaxID=1367882 RepID=A0A8J3SWK9_9ACTN|nr:hypothetical protein Pta02_39870 [Planobispora takensis]
MTATETTRLGEAGTSVVPASCWTLRVPPVPAAPLALCAGAASVPDPQAARPSTVDAATTAAAQRRRIDALMTLLLSGVSYQT